MTEIDEEYWIEEVSNDRWNLVLCPEKTEAICLAAVQADGYAIRFIENPSNEVIEVTIQQMQNIYIIVHLRTLSIGSIITTFQFLFT